MVTKDFIKERALQLIKNKGYNNVTINDICDECNITKPTFYKYIGSKEEIVLDLYDTTVNDILRNPYNFISVNTHYEQLIVIFSQIIKETEHFGSDMFSQMLIANLKENHHSFDMRNNMTEICLIMIKKAQESGEIKNMTEPAILYNALAHSFFGYETIWCIRNGEMNWKEEFFCTMNTLMEVKEDLNDIYKKYL